jgi:hypothetical protein
MRILPIFILILMLLTLNGCLIFNKISYEIKTDGKSAVAEVHIYDIRSDAETPAEFEQDKDYIFNYAWKSSDFIAQMNKEGKEIIERELYLTGDTLNAKILFKVSDISNIENIIYEDGFYYMTLPLEDEIVSTNGEVIESREYKRILWDDSFEVIKFEILGFSFNEKRYRPLGFHFRSLK